MTAEKVRVGRPQFVGITTYRDGQGRYEFRHPVGWERAELTDPLDGLVVRPEIDDDETYFAVALSDLDVSVAADDLDVLGEGFDAGIAGLPDAIVVESSEQNYNDIVKIDRTITFTSDGRTRKRHSWGLYADRWQFLVTFQGSTAEEYHYWLPMGNYCFSTFQLPFALWFATDPNVQGALASPPGSD